MGALRRLRALLLVLLLAPQTAIAEPECPGSPLVIAHRGASGYAPEHTLAAYELGILQGADVVEPDLVMSSDGVLLARHENEIGGTTDVSTHSEFAERRKPKTLDGGVLDGWWSEDFTWPELQRLRAVERIPALRPANTRLDGMFPLVSFRSFLERVAATNRLREPAGLPPIGIAPELKHTTHHLRHDLDAIPPLLALLSEFGYTGREAPAWIQSFETGALRRLRKLTPVRLVQLMEAEGSPVDDPDGPTFADLRRPPGLAEVASYADAIAVPKSLVLAEGGGTLVRHAREAGLEVHVWTLRAENRFLSMPFRRGSEEAAHGDFAGEVSAVLERCVDAIFTDYPFLAVRTRDAWQRRR